MKITMIIATIDDNDDNYDDDDDNDDNYDDDNDDDRKGLKSEKNIG